MLSILFICMCLGVCMWPESKRRGQTKAGPWAIPVQKAQESSGPDLAQVLSRAVDQSPALSIPTLLFNRSVARWPQASHGFTPSKPRCLPLPTRCVKRQRMPALQAECSKRSTSIQIYAGEIHSFSFKNLMRKDSFVKWRSKNNIA